MAKATPQPLYPQERAQLRGCVGSRTNLEGRVGTVQSSASLHNGYDTPAGPLLLATAAYHAWLLTTELS